MQSFLSGEYLAAVPELYKDLGADINPLLNQTGLSISVLQKSQNLIPYASCGYLLDVAAEQLKRPDFALLLSQKRAETGYAREIAAYSRAAKNIGLAIQGHVDHLRTRTLGIQYALETDHHNAWFSRTVSPQASNGFVQATMLMFASLCSFLRDISDHKWAPRSVSFSFKKPADIAALKQHFQCSLLFDADQDAIFFNRALLALPLATRDDTIHQMLSHYLSSRHLSAGVDFRQFVKSMIFNNLSAGRSDIEALSLRMPYRPRTIQRKLLDLGTSFQEVLCEARFELAENLLLSSDNPLTHIAHRLCFQDLSAFSKAFKKSYGVSPRAWKKAQLQTISPETE